MFLELYTDMHNDLTEEQGRIIDPLVWASNFRGHKGISAEAIAFFGGALHLLSQGNGKMSRWGLGGLGVFLGELESADVEMLGLFAIAASWLYGEVEAKSWDEKDSDRE